VERRCKRCERTLPLEAFNRYKDGHQWWCRECFKTYFRERGQRHLEQAAESRNARRQSARELVLERLRDSACVDCGERDPVVLEYDHLAEKLFAISTLVSRPTRSDLIEAEMAKCDVVCCNCHRRRTYTRRGVARTAASAARIENWKIRRNVAWMYGFLERSRCVDCGCSDPLTLEFDHVAEKFRNVTQLAWTGYALETVKAEVTKCEVRCANCHRRKTSAAGNSFRYRASTSAEAPATLDPQRASGATG
jgi:hypothetical protein